MFFSFPRLIAQRSWPSPVILYLLKTQTNGRLKFIGLFFRRSKNRLKSLGIHVSELREPAKWGLRAVPSDSVDKTDFPYLLLNSFMKHFLSQRFDEFELQM